MVAVYEPVEGVNSVELVNAAVNWVVIKFKVELSVELSVELENTSVDDVVAIYLFFNFYYSSRMWVKLMPSFSPQK